MDTKDEWFGVRRERYLFINALAACTQCWELLKELENPVLPSSKNVKSFTNKRKIHLNFQHIFRYSVIGYKNSFSFILAYTLFHKRSSTNIDSRTVLSF